MKLTLTSAFWLAQVRCETVAAPGAVCLYPCAVFMSSTVELALLTFSFILVPQAVWRDFLGHLLLESWCCQSMCPQATSPLRLRPRQPRVLSCPTERNVSRRGAVGESASQTATVLVASSHTNTHTHTHTHTHTRTHTRTHTHRNHTNRPRVRLRRAEEAGECWTIDAVLEEQWRQRRILIYLSVLGVRHTHATNYPMSF